MSKGVRQKKVEEQQNWLNVHRESMVADFFF